METYRISDRSLRRQAATTVLMAGVILVYFGYKAWSDPADRAGSIIVALIVLGVMVYYLGSAHVRRVAAAKGHSLALTSDAIVLHDGPTEHRIPYAAIEKLTIRKPLFGERWMSVKVREFGTERLYGYEGIDDLAISLASRLPRESVSGRVPSA